VGAPLSKLGPHDSAELVAESLRLNGLYLRASDSGEINVVLSNSRVNKDILLDRVSLMLILATEDSGKSGEELWQVNVASPFKSFETNLK